MFNDIWYDFVRDRLKDRTQTDLLCGPGWQNVDKFVTGRPAELQYFFNGPVWDNILI